MKMIRISTFATAAAFAIGAALANPSLAAPFQNGPGANGADFNGSSPNGGGWNGRGYNNGSWNGSKLTGRDESRTAHESPAASLFNLNNVTVRGIILNLTPQRPEAK